MQITGFPQSKFGMFSPDMFAPIGARKPFEDFFKPKTADNCNCPGENAEAKPDSSKETSPAQQQDSGQSLSTQEALSLYGHVSLDLSFAMSESVMAQQTKSDSNGSTTITQSYSRSYEASLQLDFSFLKQYAGAADKVSQMDKAVFGEWSDAASKLMDMNPEHMKDFVTATDKLFNEFEKVLGLNSTGLDNIAGFFTDQVKGFLSDVKHQMNEFEKTPLVDGKDGKINIPALFDSRQQSLPGDFKNFIEKMMAEEEDKDPKSEFLKKLKEIYKRLLDRLNNPEEKKDANNGGQNTAPVESEQEAEPTDGDPKGEGLSFSYSYFRQRTVSISAYLESMNQQAPGANSAEAAKQSETAIA